MTGIPLEERLIHEREPIVVRDVRSMMTTLGPVGSNLLRLGVNSLLIVPVVVRRKVIGSFSLDVFEPRHRSFGEHDIRRCKVFADRVGAAIENAAFSEELDTLRHVTFALTSSRRTRESLLKMIIQSAVALLQAKTGGLYEYFPDKKQLVVVSDYGYPSSTVGCFLSEGEGLAGRLVLGNRRWARISDYNRYRHRAARKYPTGREFASIIEVVLRRDNRILGVLYVDDVLGRRFTLHDARLLQSFADHAAIALTDAEMREHDSEMLSRLERLSSAGAEILSSVPHITKGQLCDMIVARAQEVFEAEAAGLFAANPAGLISLEASRGYAAGAFKRPLTRRIESGIRTGLTGHIAATGILFRAHGDALRQHPSAAEESSQHTESGLYEAVLAAPLLGRRDNTVVGLLRLDNKKTHGRVERGLYFSREDELVMGLFARVASAAVEDSDIRARLANELQPTPQHVGAGLVRRALVGLVIHQVNQLLGSLGLIISDFVDWAKANSRVPPGRKTELVRLRTFADKVANATSGFLNILETGRTTEVESLDVNKLINTTVRLFQVQLDRANVEVRTNLASDLPDVQGSTLDLLEVISNLITNSLRAMEGRPTAELRIETLMTPDRKWIEIGFSDDGEGIAAENRDKLFVPGFTTRQDGLGHGLGLFGVKQVLEFRFRGKIALRDTRIGHGTTFVILLRPVGVAKD